MTSEQPSLDTIKQDVYNLLHVIVLILSVFLVVSISIDTFNGIPFQTEKSYLKNQFFICAFFLFVFFLELFLANEKWKYFTSHLIFLIISIPYNNIIDYYNVPIKPETEYFVRFIPLLRGGYALAIIVGRFTHSKVTSLLISYVTMLLATVYFSSLLFFTLEQKVNPALKDYGNSLWWAFMNVTTLGSNIYAVTLAGRILTILLAAIGMMMFPIFTVYITSKFQKNVKKTY